MNAQDLITQWNKNHGVGAHVIAKWGTDRGLRTVTKSAAYLSYDGQAVILLNGIGEHPLEALQVAEIVTQAQGGIR